MKNNIFKAKNSAAISVFSNLRYKFKNEINTLFNAILIFVPFLFSSCEKVIELDLNSKNAQIVIEANISNMNEPAIVKLIKTVNYDDVNSFPSVTDATVILSDNIGNVETLIETSAGIYKSTSIQGTEGRTYTLKVNVNGKEYTSVSTMNSPVEINNLYISTISLPKGKQKMVSLKYNDTKGVANYYRIVEILNNDTLPTIFIEDDLKQDGETIDMTLLAKRQNEVKLKTGDSVKVQLQSVDKNVYDYFRTLLQLVGGGGLINQSTSPANPISNFDNGALGYFNAYSVSEKSIVVK
ncbi:MAG: hypothetical protein A2033_09565 [Bacteroidetes bacterium GWA2_31_9]|nr:MAG: hypothetical protein A2033_09565 [Bacteroidetes bacterium GWA2_31_9]